MNENEVADKITRDTFAILGAEGPYAARLALHLAVRDLLTSTRDAA